MGRSDIFGGCRLLHFGCPSPASSRGTEGNRTRFVLGNPSDLVGSTGFRSLPSRSGAGWSVLFDSLEGAVDASTRAAARFIVVDAIDDAAMLFYRRYGFRSCPNPRRLVRKTSEVNTALKNSDLQN